MSRTPRRSGLPLSRRMVGKGGSFQSRQLFLEALEPRILLATDLWVTQVDPTGGAGHPFDALQIQFSQAVQDGSFTLEDVDLTGPGGQIAPNGLAKLADDLYELDCAALTGLETYSLVIGPDVLNAASQPMNQDHDGTAGEVEDAYTASLFAAGVTIDEGDTTYDGMNIIVYGVTATVS